MISENAVGRLNEIDRPIIKRTIHINTKFRENYYNTSSCDFFYKFPLQISNALSVRIHSIDIPNTSYTFCKKKGSNTFSILVHERQVIKGYRLSHIENIKKKIYKIVVPEGNYSATALMNYLNETYFYQKKNNKTELKYIKFNIQENQLRSEFHLLNDTPKDYKYDIIFASGNTATIVYTMGWLLGFRMGQYINITNTLKSESLFDSAGERYIYVSIDDYNISRNDNNLIALDKNFLDKNILGKIYLKDGNFNVNVTDDDNKYNLKKRTFNGPVNFDRIHLKLYDEYGNIMNLNNMDYSIALEFEILYENWCY